MGDENPIRSLGDYSKHSHEGYKNTIELLEGNNVVPLRYDTIRLVQNGCSFHVLRFEDPNQHLKDFLKLGDTKPFDTLADLGSCVNIIPLYHFKKLNIGILEETDHVFGLANRTRSYPIGIASDVEVHIRRLKLLNEF
ncbi:hypothetical protein Tco_1374838 [Tanacetum coccineum]